MFHFIGTKGRVFKSAIKLFMRNGFDSVSLRDIASDIGIQPSTIYNHFKSKQEILDTIYDFFCYHYSENRLSVGDMAAKLQNDEVMDIFEAIRYDFNEDCAQEMSDITKIIFHRIGMDDRAREIAKTLMLDEGINYVEEIFNMGIENGRFAPFDTHAMAVFINSIRVYTLFCWVTDASQNSMKKKTDDEHDLYRLAAKQIKDLKASPKET